MTPFVVFSDLDGTLLDHDTYSWDLAKPALAALAQRAVPVVLASSKTAAEIVPLQAQMGLQGLPAIVENGAGCIGLDTPTQDAPDYVKLRAALNQISPHLRQHFTGFGDMNVDAVCDATGLTNTAAQAAKQREFSEPGLWAGTEAMKNEFVQQLSDVGVHARLGGRFLTLSYGKTKKDRMDEVMAHYGATRSIALGDAPNDIEMLEAADFGVVIANPHHAPLSPLKGEAEGRITRTKAVAPLGWNDAVLEFLSKAQIPKKGEHIG